MTGSVPPPPAPPSLPGAGWFGDPLHRHEYRYWDGAAWTEHVSDAGRTGTDPPNAPAPGFGSAPASTPAFAAGGAWPAQHDPTAVLGRRYLAFFIDLVVTLIVLTALFIPLAKQRTLAETERLPGCHRTTTSTIECDNRAVITIGDRVYEARSGPILLVDVGFSFLYFGLLTGLTGATLGKLATGIRVVKENGSIVGVGRSLIRWILWAVDGPLTLFLCGIITSATSRGHRRLGDMAAGSYVINAADVGRPPLPT